MTKVTGTILTDQDWTALETLLSMITGYSCDIATGSMGNSRKETGIHYQVMTDPCPFWEWHTIENKQWFKSPIEAVFNFYIQHVMYMEKNPTPELQAAYENRLARLGPKHITLAELAEKLLSIYKSK